MEEELALTVAYCGLICGVCSNRCEPDCRGGGGCEPGTCYQRSCCVRKGLAGCWECDEFPCGKGFFAEAADPGTPWVTSSVYLGLCIGSVQCVRVYGIEGCVRLVLANLGDNVDYGYELRFKTPQEFTAMIRGEQRPDPCAAE